VNELKRRRVFRVATIYVVAAWPLVQIADLLFPPLNVPDKAMAYLLIAFIAGFPVVLVLSWLFNLTSKGIIVAKSADDPNTDETIAEGNHHYDWVIVGSMVVVVIVFFAIFAAESPSTLQTNIPQNSASTDSANAIKSLAVLPFKTFSQEINEQYFADGLSEELAGALSTMEGLRIAANTSTFMYRDSKKSVSEIGKELNVGILLEGTVRRDAQDNRIRVSASLVDVTTGAQIWAQSFVREFKDLFKVQEEVSKAVMEQLKLKFEGKSLQYSRMPDNVDALIAQSAGNQEMQKRTVPALKSAIKWFQRAIELDASYQDAYVGLANSAILLRNYGGMTLDDSIKVAQPAIDKALAINPKSGEAFAAQGLLYLEQATSSPTSFSLAEKNLKKAIQLSPNYAPAHMWYGNVLNAQNKDKDALEQYQKAFVLDPRSVVAAHNIAGNLFSQGKEKEAQFYIDKIISIDPFYPGAFALFGSMYEKKGHLVDAYKQYLRSIELEPLGKEANMGVFNVVSELRDEKRMKEALDTLVLIEKNSGDQAAAGLLMLLKARGSAILGHIDLSIEQMKQASEMTKDTLIHQHILAEEAYFSEKYTDSIVALEKILEESKELGVNVYKYTENLELLHYVYALQQVGYADKASEVLAKMVEDPMNQQNKTQYLPSDYFIHAQVALIKGNNDQALLYLQLAINAGWTSSWLLFIDPAWKDLIKDERLLSLIQIIDQKLSSMKKRLAST